MAQLKLTADHSMTQVMRIATRAKRKSDTLTQKDWRTSPLRLSACSAGVLLEKPSCR